MPPCTAVIRAQGDVPSYLGQPCTVSLHNLPRILQPAPGDYPSLAPREGGWLLSARATLVYLSHQRDPWLLARVPLVEKVDEIRVGADGIVDSTYTPVRLGHVSATMLWRGPLELRKTRLLLNTTTMLKAAYAVGDPTSESGLPLFTSLLPGSWPAAIVPAYDRHHFDIWIRLH